MAPVALLPTPRDQRQSQRDRLLIATAEAAAARGYNALRVQDVLAASGAARRTFYAYFADKHEAFLAAYDTGAEVLATEVAVAFAEPGPWRDRLDRVLDVFLGLIASEPAFARLAFVELESAGPDGVHRMLDTSRRFVALMRGLHHAAREEDPDIAPCSDTLLAACGGGVNRVVANTLLTDGPAALPALRPELATLLRRIVAARPEGEPDA